MNKTDELPHETPHFSKNELATTCNGIRSKDDYNKLEKGVVAAMMDWVCSGKFIRPRSENKKNKKITGNPSLCVLTAVLGFPINV